MSQDAKDSSPNIFPAIRYQDAPAAIAWLGRAFGFESRMEVPNSEGSIAHAELGIGPGAIMMRSKRANPDPANPWDAVIQGIYVAVDDVDAHHRRAKEAGAEIAVGLHDTDYGSREYSVRDVEGNLWSFGTYRPSR
jgi:uncharacterized glyoxalase superfamily protein PhnB